MNRTASAFGPACTTPNESPGFRPFAKPLASIVKFAGSNPVNPPDDRRNSQV